MLFRRRERPKLGERMRIALWPRTSFSRSFSYYLKRVLRLSASSRTIGLGVAAGVFASITPFIGFHFIIAAGVALVIRGNLLASAIGTAVGNPLTFPFIWAATYEVGHWMLGHNGGRAASVHLEAPTGYSMEALSGFFARMWPVLKPMMLGSIPLGIAAGVVAYGITERAVAAYQNNRLETREEKARQRAIAALARDMNDGPKGDGETPA